MEELINNTFEELNPLFMIENRKQKFDGTQNVTLKFKSY